MPKVFIDTREKTHKLAQMLEKSYDVEYMTLQANNKVLNIILHIPIMSYIMISDAKRRYLESEKGKEAARRARIKYESNPENRAKITKRTNEYLKKRRAELRSKLFEILGGAKCVKCGYSDSRALQFDHVNGGGRQETKGDYNGNLYGYLLKYVNNPELAKSTFQVLCSNCNWIKRHENNERF